MANYCPAALSDEIWCFHMFSRVTSLPLRCQYQPQESLSESSFFQGTESWLLFKGTSAKEYRDLDTTHTAYGIFWPKVDQSSKYQSTCLWRWCFCSSCNGRSNDHWISLVFKLRRVGHFGGLSDRKNNLINWLTVINQNTKNAILS